MTYIIIALVSLLHISVCAQAQFVDDPINLCLVIFTQPTHQITENKLTQLLIRNFDTDAIILEENSINDHCNSLEIKNLTYNLKQKNIPYTITQHIIPKATFTKTYATRHICYPSKSSLQCIEYTLTLHQQAQHELTIKADIYTKNATTNSMHNLHTLKHSRRLRNKQNHYIDDIDIGIFINQNIK